MPPKRAPATVAVAKPKPAPQPKPKPRTRKQPADISTLLTVEEAARRLRISRASLYPLLMAGTLDSLKVGSRRLVPVEAIDRYINDGLTGRRRKGA